MGHQAREVFAGTEPVLSGQRHGTAMDCTFPDACFYEFTGNGNVQESDDPPVFPGPYVDEVAAGDYEIILTVLKAGRLRTGRDVYRCLGLLPAG